MPDETEAQTGPAIWNWELFEVGKFTHGIVYDSSRPNNELLGTKIKYLTGGILEPEERPHDLKARDASVKIDRLEDVARIVDMYILVSRRIRAFLQDFEIGTTVTTPAPVTAYDGSATLEGWHLLNIGAYAPLFVPEQSKDVMEGRRFWATRFGDWEIAIRRPDSPLDLWMDPNLSQKAFVSDRLKAAMQAERFTGLARFRRCRIVGTA